ncbi:FUSC family protein [Ramlibacter solisilvae]|uniref:FUSC family protein n=1 Tax=Ramlibacter tataouinensis TaxID=94132 RepID=UPI00077795CE|nr:FUSC family protein [Ramlibacter tataouinensis]
MAPHAADEKSGASGRRWLSLLAFEPGRLEFATRVALICAATTLVVQIYGTPEPALTVYIVFFLNRRDRAMSLLVCVVLLVVFTIVIGFIGLAARYVLDQPPWRVATMTAVSFGMLYLASASKLRPVGAIMALIVAYALDVLGNVPAAELATRAILYAWLFVAIPAGVSFVVNLLIGPPPRLLLQKALAQRLRVAAAVLRAGNERAIRDLAKWTRGGDGDIQAHLRFAGIERTSEPTELAALRQATRSTTALRSWLEFGVRTPHSMPDRSAREAYAYELDGMAAILQSGAYPANVSPSRPTYESAAPDQASLGVALHETISQFAEPAPTTTHDKKEHTKAGFFLPDAFINPVHLHYALKTTGAAMFCYLTYSLLDWPGIHTCFITIFIVSLSSLAESMEKLVLRVGGCLVGAALGVAVLVFVMPSITSIGGLMLVVFAGAFASAWVAGGGPRIAYAGFQIAFAFFLCVIQGPEPSFDLVVARDRVIGILFGNFVAFFAFSQVWPVSLATRIDADLSAVLRRLAHMASTEDSSARLDAAADVRVLMSKVEDNLELVSYEPTSVRPDNAWLQERKRIAQDIGALESPLLLLACRDLEASRDAGTWLDQLSIGKAIVRTSPTQSPTGGPLRSLRDQINQQIHQLELSITVASTVTRGARHEGEIHVAA